MAVILVVDDEPLIVGLLARLLDLTGHEVVRAGSGREALAVIAYGVLPDVAVVDVAMPEMSGLDFVELMRLEAGLRPPVVFLSALAWPEDVEAGERLGAVYITKPFRSEELLNAIDQALDSRIDRIAGEPGRDLER